MRRTGRASPGPIARVGLLCLLLGALGLGLPRVDFRLFSNPVRAIALNQPEALILGAVGLALLGLLLLPQRLLEAPFWWGRITGLRGCVYLALPMLAGALGFVEAARDRWRAAGMDWHDSFLCAYALLHDDLVFYAPFRSPVYPAWGVGLSRLMRLPLEHSLQVVSLLCTVVVVAAVGLAAGARMGAAAAAAGGLAALCLPTLAVHSHAVMPYPMFAAAFSVLAWGLATAASGRLRGHLLGGLGAAGCFLTDVKGLLPGVVGVACLLGLVPLVGGRRRALRSTLAIVLMASPIVLAHQWAGAQPVTPLSLEEHSARVLEDGAAASARAGGTVFGRFDGPLHPIRALWSIQGQLAAPERAQQVADRRAAAHSGLRRAYPGLTWRTLAIAALGWAWPWRGGRWRGLLGGLALVALVATTFGLAGLDFQDRYVLHAAPWLVMGAVGGLVAGCGWILGVLRGPRAAPAAALLGLLLVAILGAWDGSPLRVGGPTRGADPSVGGGQEQELRAFAHAALGPNDILVDTTWMMSSVLLLGTHPVARVPGSYPSFGVPFPEGRWRVSRPWPAAPGRRLALIGLRPAPPGQQQSAETTDGMRLLVDPAWRDLWRSSSGGLLIREHMGDTAPAWWLPGGLTAASPVRPPPP